MRNGCVWVDAAASANGSICFSSLTSVDDNDGDISNSFIPLLAGGGMGPVNAAIPGARVVRRDADDGVVSPDDPAVGVNAGNINA